jgi:hypothetical protein
VLQGMENSYEQTYWTCRSVACTCPPVESALAGCSEPSQNNEGILYFKVARCPLRSAWRTLAIRRGYCLYSSASIQRLGGPRGTEVACMPNETLSAASVPCSVSGRFAPR